MTTIKSDKTISDVVEHTWNRESAAVNLDRWYTICERENWVNQPENIALLAKVFGASWYFTRFVFFHGMEAVKYVDSTGSADFSRDNIMLRLQDSKRGKDTEENIERLRIAKNEIMFRIFLANLDEKLDQEQQESALTNLAECTLKCALDILVSPKINIEPVSILAMGRMAGHEMNYGSDLDLIFLYSKKQCGDQSILIRQIQSLLRHIALPTPCGILYEIDMRLRPHGTSGTLISPTEYFIDYHKGEREVWERQMMTRCRPIIDKTGQAANALDEIATAIYGHHDQEHLRSEILQMRKKVQQELGNPRGRYEIKRGIGGIMDIDFLTHYLQLLHGCEQSGLQTSSTRCALRQLGKLKILNEQQSNTLLESYNFLKKIEGILRIRDLKNVSAFSRNEEDPEVFALARAMGFYSGNSGDSISGFMKKYANITEQVRSCFNDMVGNPD